MFNVRLAGEHLYGKWLFTGLSLVMFLMCLVLCCHFSHEISQMWFWTSLSQFLRIFLPMFYCALSLPFSYPYLHPEIYNWPFQGGIAVAILQYIMWWFLYVTWCSMYHVVVSLCYMMLCPCMVSDMVTGITAAHTTSIEEKWGII